MVAKMTGYGSNEIPQPVDMVQIFHVGPVNNIEYFNAGFALHVLAEGNDALQAEINVIIGIASVAVTRTDANAVIKREYIAVGVETSIDGEKARTLQAAE